MSISHLVEYSLPPHYFSEAALDVKGLKLETTYYSYGKTHSDIMKRIKGRGVTKLLEEFSHLKNRYGGRYFCVTAGEFTQEMIREYLEHHFEPKDNNAFEVEK